MVRQHRQLNGHEFEQTPRDSEGQRSPVCCNPWGHKESDTTQQLNDNKATSERHYNVHHMDRKETFFFLKRPQIPKFESWIKTILEADFLLIQWLRVLLPMQGTCVRSLVQEDSTRLGATKLLSPSTLEPVLCNKISPTIRSLCTATGEQAPLAATRE